MGAVVVLSAVRCHCGHDEGDHSQNRTCRFCWRRCSDIAAKIERSSLGTPEAQALRATVSDEHAARIVARAQELADAEQGAGDVLYETPGDATYPDVLHEDVPARVDWWWTPEGRAEHDARLIAEAEARGERRGAERALLEAADALVWLRPEVSPCAPDFDSCCGSEASCDAMRPSTRVVGEKWLRDRAAALTGGA